LARLKARATVRLNLNELDDLVFRPIPIIVTVGGANEATVPAVLAEAQVDARVPGHFGIAKWERRDERIVFSSDDERRHPNAFDDAHRAGAVVIILGVLEPEMRRRVRVIELSNRSDRAQLAQVEEPWPDAILPPHASLEIPHEVPLVEKIFATLECANAGGDLEDRRNGGHRSQRRWRTVAVVASKLQRQVAAE